MDAIQPVRTLLAGVRHKMARGGMACDMLWSPRCGAQRARRLPPPHRMEAQVWPSTALCVGPHQQGSRSQCQVALGASRRVTEQVRDGAL